VVTMRTRVTMCGTGPFGQKGQYPIRSHGEHFQFQPPPPVGMDAAGSGAARLQLSASMWSRSDACVQVCHSVLSCRVLRNSMNEAYPMEPARSPQQSSLWHQTRPENRPTERDHIEAGEPPPQPGGAFPSTEEEACTGVRVANANPTNSPTGRAHIRGQHRHGLHVDTHYPTFPCYGDGVIHADVSWTDSSTAAAITEVIPVAWPKSTLPSMTRNFAHDPRLALRHFPRLNRVYGPYTYVWPKSAQATLIGSDPSVPVLPNGFLVTPVQHLDSVLRRLVTTTEEATVVTPQWTNTSWYATAIRACFEYEVRLSADARDTNPTTWAMMACHFLHRYDDKQKN